MVKDPFSFSVSPQSESDIYGIIHQVPSIHVEAFASSVYNNLNSTLGPQFVINPESNYRWQSKNIQDQWIVVNFTRHEIFTTHYSIQTIDSAEGAHYHPKKWKVEGLYHHLWTLIDEVTSSQLNNRLAVETRPVSISGPFSAFRFTSTGENWIFPITYFFMIFKIDFFGSVISTQTSFSDMPSYDNAHRILSDFCIIASFHPLFVSFI